MEKNDENIEAEILENKEPEIVESKELEPEVKSAVLVDDMPDEKVVEKEEISKENQETKKVDIIKENLESENKETTKKIETKKEPEKKHTDYRYLKERRDKKNRRVVIISVITIVIILLILLFSTIFALINSNRNTILGGISANNISIEGMTEREAVELLTKEISEQNKREIQLKINGEVYTILPEQIELEYNIEKAVKEAYSIGRDGNIFQNNFAILQTMFDKNNIDIEFTYNEELLNNILQDIGAKIPNVMLDNTYDVEEDELVITRGVAGLVLNIDEAKKAIIDSIAKQKKEPIEINAEYKECPEIDMNKIYAEVKSEPQNAYYTTDPFQIIPHKYGIDFDVEEAKRIIASENKDEYVIKLTLIEPEIKTNEIGEEAFPDLLSSFSTKYDESNVSRSNNLKIAMKKLDGVVVMPGEICSYNKTLGKRTVEDGYQYANGFSGGGVVPMLAGGICQISSTLYDAVLYANLNIVERHNHMFQAGYVEAGKDATVVYGSLDFQFENTRKYPIMIKTKCGSGIAEIKIYGVKEEVEYDIRIVSVISSYTPYKVVYENDSSLAPGVERVSQYGQQGCKSTTYRIRTLNGQEVSKEVLSSDTYDPLNKVVRRGPSASKPVSQPEQTSETPEQPVAEQTEVSTPETTQVPETPETPNTEPVQNQEEP